MLVPLRWLSEFVDLPGSPEELAEQLTMNGLEVDSIERTGPDLSEIRVGRVLERAPHPDADRLSVCTVEIGEDEPRTIVCGAPNVDAGQKVAVAVPGIRLQGKKLKKSKIRGVVSLGMICSESELGISSEHEGILVLDPEAPVGAPLDRVLDSGETLLEISVMANRGDWACMLGIAREVRAAAGQGELRVPECEAPEGPRPVGDDIRVEIADAAGCHRYAARVVRGVTIGESPEWLIEKLEAAGLRSVNNIVDVTNLVMLEFGQPLHAFDLAKLRGGVVRVRAAEAGETIRTLDGEQRTLEADDLVIADAERAIAIAGVMGGADSEVGEGTADLLLESAHFEPSRVRRTAKRLGISTDASYRFERGVDRAGIERAIDRAARLIALIAGGEVSAGIASATGSAPAAVAQIELDPARVNRVLGTQLDDAEIESALARLEIASKRKGEDLLVCTIPSHRNDLSLPIDLVEEVARIHGYDRIPRATLEGPLIAASKPDSLTLADSLRDALVADGFVELLTLPFMAESDLDAIRLADGDPRRSTVRVLNPVIEDEPRLRSTLVPALLHKARENRNRQAGAIRIFETCRVFEARQPGELPHERLVATALLIRGEDKSLWDSDPAPELFFEAKGVGARLLARLGRSALITPGDAPEPYLHPGAACGIEANGTIVGQLGELHPEVAKRFEIDAPCALIELDLDALGRVAAGRPRYQEVSRHPMVRRDLAVLVSSDQPAGDLVAAIRRQAGADLQEVELFDRYAGAGVPEGRVSLAFRLIFQRVDRTLTDAEVGKAVDAVVRMLQHRFGAERR